MPVHGTPSPRKSRRERPNPHVFDVSAYSPRLQVYMAAIFDWKGRTYRRHADEEPFLAKIDALYRTLTREERELLAELNDEKRRKRKVAASARCASTDAAKTA